MKTFKRIAYIFLALVILAGSYVYYTLWRHEVFEDATYDTTAPTLPDLPMDTRVLVFSKTNSFRHVDAIPACNAMLQDFADELGWSIYYTENAAIHTPDLLDQFDLAVWNNVSGDVLTEKQRVVFKGWLEDGGKVLGIHATGGSPSYDWDWYPQEFICAQFIGHPGIPQFQTATVVVEDEAHAAMQHLPARWDFKDEWYSFETSPRERVNVLATLDEDTYWPGAVGPIGSFAMGDHPIIWHHPVGEGTVFYSALGHRAAAYSDAHYRALLKQAARWLLGDTAE